MDARLVTTHRQSGAVVHTLTLRNMSPQTVLWRADATTWNLACFYDQPADALTTEVVALPERPGADRSVSRAA